MLVRYNKDNLSEQGFETNGDAGAAAANNIGLNQVTVTETVLSTDPQTEVHIATPNSVDSNRITITTTVISAPTQQAIPVSNVDRDGFISTEAPVTNNAHPDGIYVDSDTAPAPTPAPVQVPAPAKHTVDWDWKDCEHHQDFLSVMESTPSLSKFVDAVKRSGVYDNLERDQKYIIFAPSNEAFDMIRNIEAIFKNKAMLKDIIEYHFVKDNEFPYAHWSTGYVDTVAETKEQLYINVIDSARAMGAKTVNGAHIESAPITSCNAFIHEIDSILIPGMAWE